MTTNAFAVRLPGGQTLGWSTGRLAGDPITRTELEQSGVNLADPAAVAKWLAEQHTDPNTGRCTLVVFGAWPTQPDNTHGAPSTDWWRFDDDPDTLTARSDDGHQAELSDGTCRIRVSDTRIAVVDNI